MSINETFLKRLDLQLFAEGAGDGGTGAEGAKGATGAAAMSQTEITDSDGTTAQVIDRKAEFDKLIKGEYKEFYDAKVQDTVQKRVKGLKEKEGKLDALTPTLEMLAKKYGVDASDIEALNKAIEEDDAYYEEDSDYPYCSTCYHNRHDSSIKNYSYKPRPSTLTLMKFGLSS